MMLIDLSAVRAAWRFLADNPGPIVFAALLYAPVFAAQSVWSAQAAVGSPGAAPLAILAALAGLAVFVVSLSAWGRLTLHSDGAGVFAHRLGKDEQRLGVVTLLLFVLTFTVVGTAFLAVAFMIAALALINVDAEAPAPEGRIDIFAMFGPGEMAVAIIVIGAFALFSFWFFLRLALAYPATVALGRVQVLTAWPLSRGNRAAQMLTSTLLACVPGALVLAVLNVVSNALLGAWPLSASSATSGEAVSVNLIAFAAVSALHGVVKIALIGAPAAVVLCLVYQRVSAEDRTAPAEGG
jgi:hypothetical protein